MDEAVQGPEEPESLDPLFRTKNRRRFARQNASTHCSTATLPSSDMRFVLLFAQTAKKKGCSTAFWGPRPGALADVSSIHMSSSVTHGARTREVTKLSKFFRGISVAYNEVSEHLSLQVGECV